MSQPFFLNPDLLRALLSLATAFMMKDAFS
jgi:hypothetical protein